jgi:NADH:ubiquinone oxidoreductase subunit 3 (subunit A)
VPPEAKEIIDMPNEWLYVGIFMMIAGFLPTAALIMAGVLGPKKGNPVKSETYECGMQTVGDTWIQFRIQYYIFALVFLVFDVETIFLFPWAVAYNNLPLFGVLEAVLFILILAGGLAYLWRKNALEWQ